IDEPGEQRGGEACHACNRTSDENRIPTKFIREDRYRSDKQKSGNQANRQALQMVSSPHGFAQIGISADRRADGSHDARQDAADEKTDGVLAFRIARDPPDKDRSENSCSDGTEKNT